MIEHWNGQQWSSGPTPPLRAGETYQLLTGIAYDSQSHQLWAVGETGKFQIPTAQTLIVRLPVGA